MREAADLQTRLWLGDGYDGMLAAAESEGDPGALTVLRFHAATARSVDMAAYSRLLTRRNAIPASGACFWSRPRCCCSPSRPSSPSPTIWTSRATRVCPGMGGADDADRVAADRHAGPDGVDGAGGDGSGGLQVIAGRFREDLCLLAGEAIEAGGGPVEAVDPA